MKIKEIRDLVDFLSNTGLEEVNIETDEFKIKVKRSNDAQVIERSVSPPLAPVAPAPIAATAETTPPPSTNNYLEIKSPMIGTFYRSTNPDTPAFVNVGDKVSSGNAVCIVEAMKLFNEIESEISGTIVKVLVDNAQPVEYDQPLFLVDPA